MQNDIQNPFLLLRETQYKNINTLPLGVQNNLSRH